MFEQPLQLIISITTVILSISTSVIVTSIRNRAELKKIKIQLEQQYAKSLFDKRSEFYPKFYELLSNYGKKIYYNKQNTDNLKEFKDALDVLDSEFGIFFTIQTRRIAAGTREYLTTLLKNKDQLNENNEFWKEIKDLLIKFENTLRAEIGIFGTQAASQMFEAEAVKKMIAEKFDKLKTSL